MFNSPFRKEALDNRNQRQQLDHLLKVTAPHERIIVAGIAVVLLALVAWAVFGRIPAGVTADGVLVKSGDRIDVVALESGQLLSYLIEPGDRVEAGSQIARQSLPTIERQISALRERMDLIQAQASALGTSPNLASIRESILQLQAQRTARELLVSHGTGEVMALGASPGQFLTPGAAVALIRGTDAESLKAVVRVAARVAQRIEPGMRAVVEVDLAGEAMDVVDGAVAAVTRDPAPHWLTRLLPAQDDSEHLVEVVFDPAAAFATKDGTPCRVRIEFGSYSPIAIFNFVRS